MSRFAERALTPYRGMARMFNRLANLPPVRFVGGDDPQEEENEEQGPTSQPS